MKKNNTQFTTKKEKKLYRRLKFMVWVCKTFTKEKVMAAVCGISLGLSCALSIISFAQTNLLGGFGFLLASLWSIGSWTSYLVSKEKKEKPSNFANDYIMKVFDLITKTNSSTLENLDNQNKKNNK